jgi:hypothetical protein
MHSRIYAERFDLALKKMAGAIDRLAQKGLVQAEPMPVERDPRILELRRLEYAADVLGQLAHRADVFSQSADAKAPRAQAKKTSSKKTQKPKAEPKVEAPADQAAPEVPEPAPVETDTPATTQTEEPPAEAEVEQADKPATKTEAPKTRAKRSSKKAKADKEG